MQNVAKAKLSYSRISSRKMKIVIDLIRNKPVGTALAILKYTPKAASPLLEKLLISAMSNAENNQGMDVDKLYVSEIYAGAGPTLKRIRPRAQGRAFRINKRTSHTTIVLKELETVANADTSKKASKNKAKKIEETVKIKKATTAKKHGETAAKPRKPRAPRKKAEVSKETKVAE